MHANHNARQGHRLIDIPHLPAEQALLMLATMPEGFGLAIAKLCYRQLSPKR